MYTISKRVISYHYLILILAFSYIIFFMVMLIVLKNNIQYDFLVFSVIISVFSTYKIISSIKVIKDIKYLIKNGTLIKNLTYETKTRIIIHPKVNFVYKPKNYYTLLVKLPKQYGEDRILKSKYQYTISDIKKNKTVDLLIDPGNLKRFYIDFNIKKIRGAKDE